MLALLTCFTILNFITHNPHHAYLVGNHFVVLKLGRVALDTHRADITLEQLTTEMAGGSELEALSHELREIDPGVVVAPADGDAGRPADTVVADDEEKGQAGT